MKTAFIFSGQGAQSLGMGKQLYENYPVFKETCDEAEQALGYSISDIMFNDEKKLNETEFCQPAILTMSIAASRILDEKGIKADITAGLSLGEYSALTYSGAVSFADAVKLVQIRGRLMQNAVPPKYGAMCAILGGDPVHVESACMGASSDSGKAYIANYNTLDQLVISGEAEAVRKASVAAQHYGAKKAIMLNVSGPFHTPLLSAASSELKEELVKIDWEQPSIPVISNLTADEIRFKRDIPDILAQHMISPVRWYQSVETMVLQGVDTFVEIGPGKTLSAFVKKTNKQVKVLNVEDEKSLAETLKVLQIKELL